jgi:hypothetical protein
VYHVHLDPSIALLYLLRYSTADLPFPCRHSGQTLHRPRRTLRPTDRNNKDDVFAEDKVREFKASNPDAETHIRSQFAAESSHSPTPTQSQLLTQHTLHYMSSDAGSNLAQEYPAGAIADSPIPLLQEFPIHSPVPIVDFATMQSLDPSAISFVPRPVTAQSSALDVTAMFRQLRVSQTYTSVSDKAQDLRNPPDIFPTSLGKRRERPVQSGLPRTTCMKGLNNHLPNQEVRP